MRNSFTLIELVIVIAIIAVLAVIAVPNIVESRARSSVAQSMANMRAIDTGLSAYRVDHRGALPSIGQWSYYVWRWGYHIALTTPVPYMTSVPEDPIWWQQTDFGPNYFYEYHVFDHNIIHALLLNPVGTAPGMWGPVGNIDRNSISPLDPEIFHRWSHGNASFVLFGRGPNINGSIFYVPYDPTNGLDSPGQIFHYH